MAITEKEIFNYVFFREALGMIKIIEIENNNKIQDELKYYIDLKEELSLGISDNVKNKLAAKIPVYSNNDVVTLHPLILPDESKSIKLLKYAAATGSNTNEPVITFANENKEYFIRLHKTEDKYKIFVFSTHKDDIEQLELTFYPSREKVSINKDQNPFSISLSQIPDKIDIRLN